MSVKVDLAEVQSCQATGCAYNRASSCNAPAVTIGNTVPHCDTFLSSDAQHVEARRLPAGVGACKTTACRYNDDLACTADAIHVSTLGVCLTMSP